MTARGAETARRRRLRREAREKAWREWVVGGPLVDISEPIIGGNDANHPALVDATIRERVRIVSEETVKLADAFARECWVTLGGELAMMAHIRLLLMRAGPPQIQTTHSTHPAVSRTTIYRLES